MTSELYERSQAIQQVIATRLTSNAEGRDPDGLVTAVVDPGGMLRRLSISGNWRKKIRSSELAGAVMNAITSAKNEQSRIYAQEYDALADCRDEDVAMALASTAGQESGYLDEATRYHPSTDHDRAEREERIAQLLEEMPKYAEFMEKEYSKTRSYSENANAVRVYSVAGVIERIDYLDEWVRVVDHRDIEELTVRAVNRAEMWEHEVRESEALAFPAISRSRVARSTN